MVSLGALHKVLGPKLCELLTGRQMHKICWVIRSDEKLIGNRRAMYAEHGVAFAPPGRGLHHRSSFPLGMRESSLKKFMDIRFLVPRADCALEVARCIAWVVGYRPCAHCIARGSKQVWPNGVQLTVHHRMFLQGMCEEYCPAFGEFSKALVSRMVDVGY